ncbi:MAG: hypothetical protein WC477_07675 [Patescibacteria group bacterium]
MALFVITTYALIPETRTIIEPILDNISFSAKAGEGVGVEVANIGVMAVTGVNGYECTLDGRSSTENGTEVNLTVFTYSSYYSNGKFYESVEYGVGPLRLVFDDKGRSWHLKFSIGGNPNLAGGPIAFGELDINYGQMMKDYFNLLMGGFK